MWRRVVFSRIGDLTRTDELHERRSSLFPSLAASAGVSLFSTLFPSDCRFCGSPLTNISRVPVCDTCLDKIQRMDGPVCPICGDRLLATYDSAGERACCGECLREKPPFQKAIAYGAYEGALRDLIHLLKYDRVRPAANLLGRMVGEAFTELSTSFEGRTPLVVPVPLHARKMRERGFNQSELVARTALKCSRIGQLEMSILERKRATETQTGLTPHQRRLNLRGAFRVVRADVVSGKDILLVDDVFTTGTTVSECARVLKRAGAERIWVATAARALLAEHTGVTEEFEAAESQSRSPMAMAARA